MNEDGEKKGSARMLLGKYRQGAYALALHLVFDDDAAYECAARAFVDALALSRDDGEEFRIALFRNVVGACRESRVIPRPDEPADMVKTEKRYQFSLLKKALGGLDFETRAAVLLRDQLRLPYRLIARVLGTGEPEARARTFQARGQLREKITEALRHG